MFFDNDNWVEAARNDFQDPQGDGIRRDMILRLAEWDLFPSCSGDDSHSNNERYHGRYFLMSYERDGIREAWFGFADSDIWIRGTPKKHEMELIIAYRDRKIQLTGNEYRLVGTKSDILGRLPPNNWEVDHGWVVEFDKTWNSREVWTEKLREIRQLGREGSNLVKLDEDVAAIFTTEKAVNDALRSLAKIIRQYEQSTPVRSM